MDERRSAEGVEHLQAAARELLGAARAFLDVVEDVVEDSERFSGAAATVSDLLRNGLGMVGGHDEPRPGPSRTAAWWDEPVETGPVPAEKAPIKKAAKKAPAKQAGAKQAGARKKPSAPAAKKPAPARPPEAHTPGEAAGETVGTAEGADPAPSGPPKRSGSRVRRIAVD